jgi:hypothetical protein
MFFDRYFKHVTENTSNRRSPDTSVGLSNSDKYEPVVIGKLALYQHRQQNLENDVRQCCWTAEMLYLFTRLVYVTIFFTCSKTSVSAINCAFFFSEW